jgi:hypothetical protein
MSDKSAPSMHKLLARQIRRHLDPEMAALPALAPFLAAVEDAYREGDADRLLVEPWRPSRAS